MEKINDVIKDMIDSTDPTQKLIGLLSDLFESKVQIIDENISDIKQVLINLEKKMTDHDKQCPFDSPLQIKKLEQSLVIKMDQLEQKIDAKIEVINQDIDIIRVAKKYKWISILGIVGIILGILIYGIKAAAVFLFSLIK